MRAYALEGDRTWADRKSRRLGTAVAALGILTLAGAPSFAFDGATTSPPVKIAPKGYSNPAQALRAGIDDMNAGDIASSVEALTYAAEGGEPIAQWKLGQMYADGDGVARDDVKAYHYFNRLLENYNEDAPDQRSQGAISNAAVSLGVYCLKGIPNSAIHPDPERAGELFQFAASTFGDPAAEYNLARMYIVGAGGLAKDNMIAARWLMLASEKGHSPSQAVLGHMLFAGDGVARQRAKGLMWLQLAKNGANGPNEDWIRQTYQRDFAAASDDDRQVATAMLDARPKGPPVPALMARDTSNTAALAAPLAPSSQQKPAE